MLTRKDFFATSVSFALLVSIASSAGASTIYRFADNDGDGIPDTDMRSANFNLIALSAPPAGRAVNKATAGVSLVDTSRRIPVGTAGYVDEGEGGPVLIHLGEVTETASNCLVGVPASTIPGTAIPTAECPQGRGPAAVDLDDSDVDRSLGMDGFTQRYFDVNSSASAGDDLVTSFLHVASNDSDFSGIFDARATAVETQQVMFNVTGSDIPEYIGIDIDLSLAAGLGGNLLPFASNGVSFSSYSGINIYDLDSGQFGGTVDMPFSAAAVADSIGSDTLDGVYTVLFRPNRNYEVALTAGASVSTPRPSGGPLNNADFSGLDLTFTAFADPVFSLNQDWLNNWLAAPGHTDLGISIDRTINRTEVSVPEPGTFALLAAGLLVIGSRSQRVRRLDSPE